jgi:Ca2+-binding RTX toxin-like protein
MASIVGSQFVTTASGENVNVVETSGGALPLPKPGVFNLEVWTGNPADAPSHPAHGYQGLAILEDGGHQIDLISGAFAVTDDGTGRHDTLNADGNEETVRGGTADVTMNLFGNRDIADGGGQDTINVFGKHDTVNGSGNDLISVFGTHDVVNGGDGRDTISVFGNHDAVNAGTGNEQIYVFGSHDRVTGGTGNDSVGLFGSDDHFSGGMGNETVTAFGSHDSIGAGVGDTSINVFGDANTISGGMGDETISVFGNDNVIVPGTGISSINIFGTGDRVDAGQSFFSEAQIDVNGGDFRLNEGAQNFADTVVGFDQHAGDRIHLTTESVHDALGSSQQINGGHDTLITLNDGSTILLKGISQINHGFFS